MIRLNVSIAEGCNTSRTFLAKASGVNGFWI